jgi:hypothetical protein
VIGRENNERQLVVLAAGLVVPIAAIGFIAEVTLPVVLIADFAFAVFIFRLPENLRHILAKSQ